LPEVVGDAGLLFDPRSAGEIAAVIARLLGTEGLRADLARRAEARSGLFTWERAADLALVSLESAVR
jgi:glycosyltransferase involved in cell wall biosynthesis